MLPKRRCCVCLLEREDKDFLVFSGSTVCRLCVNIIAAHVITKGTQALNHLREGKEVKEDAAKSGDGV
jgi:hypothetical protein